MDSHTSSTCLAGGVAAHWRRCTRLDQRVLLREKCRPGAAEKKGGVPLDSVREMCDTSSHRDSSRKTTQIRVFPHTGRERGRRAARGRAVWRKKKEPEKFLVKPLDKPAEMC